MCQDTSHEYADVIAGDGRCKLIMHAELNVITKRARLAWVHDHGELTSLNKPG